MLSSRLIFWHGRLIAAYRIGLKFYSIQLHCLNSTTIKLNTDIGVIFSFKGLLRLWSFLSPDDFKGNTGISVAIKSGLTVPGVIIPVNMYEQFTFIQQDVNAVHKLRNLGHMCVDCSDGLGKPWMCGEDNSNDDLINRVASHFSTTNSRGNTCSIYF